MMDKKDIDKITHTKYVPKLSIAYNFKEVVESAKLFDVAENVTHDKFSSFKYYNANFKIGDTIYKKIKFTIPARRQIIPVSARYYCRRLTRSVLRFIRRKI